MRSKPAFVSLFLLLLCYLSKGQKYNPDSALIQVEQIRGTPVDTAQITRLRVFGGNLMEYDSSLSRQLLEEALKKSLAIGEANSITDCYRLLGNWYSYFDYKDSALEYYRLSRRSAAGNRNLYMMAGADFNMGNIKYWKGEYDSCIHYYLKAADIFESPEMLDGKSLTQRRLDMRKSDLYSNLSSVFNTLKNVPKADEFIDKAIAIARKYDSPAAADALAYYMQMKADNHSENGDPETSLRIRLQFLPQVEQGNEGKANLQTAYQNISRDFFELDKLDSSRLFARKSLELAMQLKAPSGIAGANQMLGRIAMYEKQYQAAEKHLDAARGFYEKTEDLFERRKYFNIMRELKYAQGRYKEAYDYFEKYSAVNDSLTKGEAAKEFSEREARYQAEKKEARIQLQEAAISRKSTINYILIGSVVALLLIFLLTWRNYSHSRKLQQARIDEFEKEKQLAATEAVLKGEEQERTRLAKDLHDGLGGMLSGIKYSFQNMKENLILTPENALAFERSIDMLDSTIREMRRVAHNMMPEVLVKYGFDTALKEFCSEIDRSGVIRARYQSIGMENATIERSAAITVYRIVQELVNNAVKHAASENVLVQAHFSPAEKLLTLTVEDDGKGFDASMLSTAEGIGWNNIRNRVDFLKGRIDIDSAPGKGTSVLIEMNI